MHISGESHPCAAVLPQLGFLREPVRSCGLASVYTDANYEIKRTEGKKREMRDERGEGGGGDGNKGETFEPLLITALGLAHLWAFDT